MSYTRVCVCILFYFIFIFWMPHLPIILGCMYAKMDLALNAALLQSALLQNNRGMFRPVTIPQYLSEEGEPEIIQAVLISR